MAKLIAVCGAPGSGKTALALKLAIEINKLDPNKEGATVFLSPDLVVPSMSLIYPRCKKEELYSMGTVIDKTEIYRDDLLRSMNGIKTLHNFGMLGFVCGENRYSYPSPTEDKVMELLSGCKQLADYTVVDCCSGDDLISHLSRANADTLVKIVNPDIKCLSYYASCGADIEGIPKKVTVMNVKETDSFAPVDEVNVFFKGADFSVPYSEALRQQMLTGTLTEGISDNRYRKVIKAIAQAVM